MSGQRMLLGPASYSDQTLLSSSSTIIWKERHRGERKHKTSEVLQPASRIASRNFQHLVNVIILKTFFYSSSQELSGCFLTGMTMWIQLQQNCGHTPSDRIFCASRHKLDNELHLRKGATMLRRDPGGQFRVPRAAAGGWKSQHCPKDSFLNNH